MDLHGGNVYKLMRKKKIKILDYSSNINPLGVPERLKVKIVENLDILEKYPDIDYLELKESIGDYNRVPKQNILVGNGATEILFLYMKALKPRKVMIVSPTFAEYERALQTLNTEVDFFKLEERENFELDIEKLKLEISNHELVVICNPNNPTGNFIEKSKLKDLNDFFKERKVKLFIDECFIEFIENWENETVSNLKDKNIFILRALTKFFALPGIRLGYGISYNEEIVKKIEKIKEPWSVNAFADLAGKIILEDKEYIERTNEWIKNERKWFYENLLTIDEIKPYKTHSNFILIKLKSFTSEKFCKLMENKGILVRNAANFKFLDNSYVRLAIKNREKNMEILEKIREVLR